MFEETFYHQNTLPSIAEPVPFPMPSKIGPYRIESQLGKGGMSFLYLAAHPKWDEPIVIKVLSPKFITHKEMVKRFLQEAEIIGITDHPNIIKLYDQGQWERGLYIAMEFIQGISLRQFILQKSLSQKRALQIVQEVAYALLHLHTHGVIHRDLKPENILITESGKVKVIDFGIAQLHSDLVSNAKEKQGQLIGTPVYMSPEQKENPNNISFMSDIYSLGVIAYELILGRLSHGVIHLSFLPESLREIIEKTLEADPKNRYQDIVDVITAINIYIKSLADKKEKEPFEDAFAQFLKEQKNYFTPHIPKWPELEIGYAKEEDGTASGIYYDFIQLLPSSYFFVIAETNKTGLETCIPTALIKGAVSGLIFSNQKKTKLSEFVNTLHLLLAKQPQDCLFKSNFLHILPDENTLSFISCNHTPIYHYSSKIGRINTLHTPNPSLGTTNYSPPFLEIKDNCYEKDQLLICSSNVAEHIHLADIFSTNIHLSAQNLAEKILQKYVEKKKGQNKGSALILVLSRNF